MLTDNDRNNWIGTDRGFLFYAWGNSRRLESIHPILKKGIISADLCKRMMDREKEKRGVKKLGFKARVSTPSISLKYLDENGSVIRDEVLEPTRTYGGTPVPYNTTSEYSFVYFKNGEYWKRGFPYAAVVRQSYKDDGQNCSTVVDIVQDYEIISLVSDELLSNTAKVEVSYLE